MKKILVGAALLSLFIGLVGCSSSPAQTGETASSIGADVIAGYFEAVLSTGPADSVKAVEFASPGSNAEAYAIEQTAHMQALLDGGLLNRGGQEVVIEENQVLYCEPGHDEPDVDRAEYCVTFDNFEFDGDRLSDFDTGGKPLEGRITIGDDAPIDIGKIGKAKVIASYETVSGDLVVNLEVTSSTKNLTWDGWRATYLGTNGRQMAVSSMDGPYELKDGFTANVSFLFSEAQIGGTLEVKFIDADWNEISVEFPTK